MEEATEELKTAKTKLATAETKLADAETELNDAKKNLADAQSQYDKEKNPSKKITEKFERARVVADRCTDVVTSKEATVNSKQAVILDLKNDARSLTAAAPGKCER